MDISRVLFSSVALPRLRAVIYLGRLLPNASSGSVLGTGKRTNRSSFDLAPNRGLPSQRLSTLLVRSYRTFAPLPPARGDLTRGERNYREPLTSYKIASCLRRRYVSVALSSRSPALGVTQQVWSFGSPDFPQISLRLICNHLRLLFP